MLLTSRLPLVFPPTLDDDPLGGHCSAHAASHGLSQSHSPCRCSTSRPTLAKAGCRVASGPIVPHGGASACDRLCAARPSLSRLSLSEDDAGYGSFLTSFTGQTQRIKVTTVNGVKLVVSSLSTPLPQALVYCPADREDPCLGQRGWTWDTPAPVLATPGIPALWSRRRMALCSPLCALGKSR